jgi:membrane-associated phospholipid phosphatase
MPRRSVLSHVVNVSAVGLALTAPPMASLVAQNPDTASSTRGSLFTRGDAYFGVLWIAGTLALAPLDKRIAGNFQTASAQSNQQYRRLATDLRFAADPGLPALGVTMYVVGRLAHFNRVADLALHAEEAMGVAAVVTQAIALTAGRARPYVVADSNPRDFQFLGGFRKGKRYSSFPSGHTMAVFAAASAVTDEASRSWPDSRWYVGTVMYGGATAVGLARLYDNQHWATDVFVGAGMGILIGNKVVRFNHRTNPRNRFDRWLLSTSIVPTGHDGLALMWSTSPP